MPSKDHGDLKNSMVFIRREAIEVVPSEVPFSKKVFGRTCVTYWRSLGCLLMSLGGLWEVSACPLNVSRMSLDVLRRSLGGSLQSLESPDVVF